MTPLNVYKRIFTKVTAPLTPVQRLPIWMITAGLGHGLDPDCCWIWTGAFSKKRRNYRPNVQIEPGRFTNPFRLLLILKTGVKPEDVAHLHAAHNAECDNPKCVNPFHGHWATHRENQQERARRHPESYIRKDKRHGNSRSQGQEVGGASAGHDALAATGASADRTNALRAAGERRRRRTGARAERRD